MLIRIRTSRRIEDTETLTLCSFFRGYFSYFYGELNSLLSDYHSIQEHSNRGKIVEFVGKKLKDLDLLQVFVKGCFMLKGLKMIQAKGEDCVAMGRRMIEMADFLAVLFESMKTSFIPRANFPAALLVLVDPGRLLPRDVFLSQSSCGMLLDESTAEPSEEDFDHIHRLMRIYLLKENVGSYRLSKGVLVLRSKFFEFELALCGDIRSPEWRLFRVRSHTCNKQVEEYLLRRFHSSPSEITRFTLFYEARKNASEIFSILESGASGFYQNFTGKIRDAEVSGVLKKTTLRCTITRGKHSSVLINPSCEDIQSITSDAGSFEEIEEARPARPREFKAEILGENIACLGRGMFFCFSKARHVCFVGKYPQICGLEYIELDTAIENGRIVAVHNGSKLVAHGNELFPESRDVSETLDVSSKTKEEMDGRKFREMMDVFVQCNARYLSLVKSVSDLKAKLVVDRGITGDFFMLDSDMVLHSLPENTRISHDGWASMESLVSGDLEHRIRLLYVQKHLPEGYEMVESKVGERLQLRIHGINVLVTGSVKTDLKFLTEDCKSFNLTQALDYIRNFGVFYKFSLHPLVFYVNKVVFDFEDFIGETVQVLFEDGVYRITGPATLQMLKITGRFTADDTRIFMLLFKAYIADRFMRLKKAFGTESVEHSVIDLGGGRTISLTAEGIKYRCSDARVSAVMTRVLNTERSVLKYITKSSEELLQILKSHRQ